MQPILLCFNKKWNEIISKLLVIELTRVFINNYLQGQHLDIIGFNRYNAWYSLPGHTEIIRSRLEDEATKWHVKHNKPVFMTEYGADTLPGLHMVLNT